VSIVKGLDQHRAHVTAEWLETSTGEVKRAQIAERIGGNRACLSIARKLQAQLPHVARARRRGGAGTRMSFPVRAKPFVTPTRRGRLPTTSCGHAHWTA
jgi:hypothetical protein